MDMAYIATDKKGKTYAICSANPDFVADAAKELQRWKKDGATIELLPLDEAKQKFCSGLTEQKQQSLF